MIWCEHCRGHFEDDHYRDDRHKVGPEFGPYGKLLDAGMIGDDHQPTIRDVLDAVGELNERLESSWDSVVLHGDVRRTHALLDALGAPTRDSMGTVIGISGRVTRLLDALLVIDRDEHPRTLSPLGRWLRDASSEERGRLAAFLNLPTL